MAKTKLRSNPLKLTKYLAGATVLLATVNIIIQFAIYSFGLKKEWFLLFNMDKEVNIPTMFSCTLLLFCAVLINILEKGLGGQKRQIKVKWFYLKWLFVFLSLDEGLQIHEIFIIPSIKNMLPPIISIVWVIPYGIFVFFAAIYFLPLIRSMPHKIRNMTLSSGVIYISGAMGFEVLGSYLVRTGDIKLHGISYGLISTLEETLEMVGIIIFIYTLLIYIFNYQNQKLKINVRISKDKAMHIND